MEYNSLNHIGQKKPLLIFTTIKCEPVFVKHDSTTTKFTENEMASGKRARTQENEICEHKTQELITIAGQNKNATNGIGLFTEKKA